MPQPVTTIFATATPPGRSAIAIVRISGPLAHEAPALFGARCPGPGRFHVARLTDANGEALDEALVLAMAGPASSTGEDVVEIHTHGSMAVTKAILARLAAQKGFRVAEPGEFTHRGFANGKIDLLGSEALADLVDAETDLQRVQAWRQLDGALHRPVERWRESVVKLASRLEALIDFADEELPGDLGDELRRESEALRDDMAGVLNDKRFAQDVREGVSVGILGPVNAGKSTLLNILAGRDVAIVSSKAGTTRDVLQLRIDLDGVPVTLLDTAGIRETGDDIEAEGVRRAIEAARNVQAALIVIDASAPDWRRRLDEMRSLASANHFVILNKMDLATGDVSGDVDSGAGVLSMSLAAPAKKGGDSSDNQKEVDGILDALRALVIAKNLDSGDSIITRERHRSAIAEARDAIDAALAHDPATSPELAAEDYRRAADSLGRITGRIDVEQLLDSIFSSFCIGK